MGASKGDYPNFTELTQTRATQVRATTGGCPYK